MVLVQTSGPPDPVSGLLFVLLGLAWVTGLGLAAVGGFIAVRALRIERSTSRVIRKKGLAYAIVVSGGLVVLGCFDAVGAPVLAAGTLVPVGLVAWTIAKCRPAAKSSQMGGALAFLGLVILTVGSRVVIAIASAYAG